jgi:hypothetical protein
MENKLAKFNKKTKQKIIDAYLNDTGRNAFVPEEFVTWLADKPNHIAYKAFHGQDEHLLWQAKLQLARQFVSGLRIVVKETVVPSTVQEIEVVERTVEYPAMISPTNTRKQGGGYISFDPESPQAQAELRKQAGIALAGWLDRFRGCADHIDLDLSPIEDIVRVLRDDKAIAAE